jgi:heterotetrameric sarcosine oxidase delta subunit
VLRIPCPHCGLRDESEFRYGGEAGVKRPGNPQSIDDRAWADYLFFRDNVRGPQLERWFHAYGCRLWFELARDTLTHEWLDGVPEQ